jgi:hypothetical protein
VSAEGKKGGGYEKYLLETYIQQAFPDAYRPRLRGVHDNGDFAKVGDWLIEAKKRDRWDLGTWIRAVMAKKKRALLRGETESLHSWMILFAGDKRSSVPYDLAVLPTEVLFNLLVALREAQEGVYSVSPTVGDGKETE